MHPVSAGRYYRVILALVLLAQFLPPLVLFSLGALAPLLRDALALNHGQIGFLAALFSMSAALCAIPSGWGADKLGIRGLLSAVQAVGGLALVATAWLRTYAELCLVMFLAGMTFTTVLVLTSKAIAEWFPRGRRSTAMGAKSSALAFAGIMAGAVMLPLALGVGWRQAFALVGGLMLASACWDLLLYRERPQDTSPAAPLPAAAPQRALWRDRHLWALALAGFCFGGVQYSFTTYLALFLSERWGMSSPLAASLLAQAHVGAVVSRVPYGWLSDRWLGGDCQAVLQGLSAVALGVLLLLLLLPPGLPLLLLSVIILLYGLSGLAWGGLYQSVAVELSSPERAGVSAGIATTLLHLGTFAIAPVFGYLVDVTGSYTTAWGLLLLAQLLGIVLLGWVRPAPVPRQVMAASGTPSSPLRWWWGVTAAQQLLRSARRHVSPVERSEGPFVMRYEYLGRAQGERRESAQTVSRSPGVLRRAPSGGERAGWGDGRRFAGWLADTADAFTAQRDTGLRGQSRGACAPTPLRREGARGAPKTLQGKSHGARGSSNDGMAGAPGDAAASNVAGAPMYLDFYRLKSAPFQSTPDPTMLFLSASHHAALDAMAAGIAARQGLVAITGARGVGKTTLVRAYLARVAPPQLTTMVLWQAPSSFLELLTLMASRFAGPVATDDATALLAQLQHFLQHEAQQGRQVALIIDEAQHLPLETLEQLPLLADLTPSGEPPLQIVLVGEPALQQHLRRRALRRVAQRISLHATLSPMTEAESLAYIRQRVAKVALPGGPLFTPGALQAMVRHTHGVPRDVNLLCTNVLQAGFWVHQQPITADLVQQVRAASRGARLFSLGRLGLAAAAGVVLTAGLLWLAPFSAGPQASRGSPAARVHAWLEARRPTSAPLLEAPLLPQPEPAPQARTASPPSSAVGPDSGEGHVRLGPLESLESQPLETSPALLTPGVTPTPLAASAPSASLPARAPRTSPAAPRGPARKSCDELKAEIQAKLDAKRITGYALTIIARGDQQGQQIVGSCEGNTKKIALNRSRNAQ
jgi:type II secretory pathway predicted ATPase ExeA/nitrate/nitrite transporter NarK